MKVATVKLLDEVHMQLKLYSEKNVTTISDLLKREVEKLLENDEKNRTLRPWKSTMF